MGENLSAQSPLFPDIPLHEPTTIRKILVARLRDNFLPYAPIRRPCPMAFLRPDRQLRPGFSHAQSCSVVSARRFDDREDADHWLMFRFLNESVFHANFNIANAKR